MKKLLYSATVVLAASSILLFSCKKDDGEDNKTLDCTATDLGASSTVKENDITVTAFRGKEPYTYSIDGTNFQASNTFNDKEVGDYTVTVKDANNCTATAAAKVNNVVIGGQAYKTVKIGNQVWMAENLNMTTTTSSDCCTNTSDTCRLKGVFYTYTEAKNICPTGWHLPTGADWSVLEATIGMTQQEIEAQNTDFRGSKANELRVGGSSGFNAVMSGYSSAGTCESTALTGFWINDGTYNNRVLQEGFTGIRKSNQTAQTVMATVRCIKN